MKTNAERKLCSIVGKILFLGHFIFAFFLPSVMAEEPAGKKHYESSIVKVTENNLFSVEVMVPGNALQLGINKAELVIYDSSGNDVEDAQVKITPWMPVMDQGVFDEPVVTEKGGGFYDAENIVIHSAGQWALWIKVKKDGTADTVIIDFPKIEIAADRDKTVPVGKTDTYRTLLKPLPAIPPIPADNGMTAGKIKLGKMLYWDRRVSKTGATSCVFCHYPSYYGAEPMRKSVGIDGEVHLRNAQTVLNSAFLTALFWAGESPDLEHQALGAVKSHVAMRSVPDDVAERLNRIDEYRERSIAVFGKPLTGETIGKALAAYMRTLVTPDYPLARWIQGDEHALTEDQKKGMALFVDKGCIGCHYGPVFSGPVHNPSINTAAEEHPGAPIGGLHLHKVIVPGAEDDPGLAKKTQREEDKYFFKVPLLLNVAETPPYTHAGLIDNLNDMVTFMAGNMLNIKLTSSEINDIVTFLHSLTGEIPADFMTVPVLPTGGGEGDFGPELLPSGGEEKSVKAQQPGKEDEEHEAEPLPLAENGEKTEM